MPVSAAAFAVSFVMPLLLVAAALQGSWWLLGVPLYGWVVSSLLDRLLGLEAGDADPETPERALFWHCFLTWAWVPTQVGLIALCLHAATAWLSGAEALLLIVGLGVATGGIGITYAHELIHSKLRFERNLGAILLASVGYGHFATEHLANHHVHVATPRDHVTARYGEGFWRFLPRAVWGTLRSAWEIDRARLRRRGTPFLSLSNPWVTNGAMTAGFLALAFLIGGWAGIGLWMTQAAVAILQLEAVNYVEHYGLTRKHLGNGRFEPARAHHSWNAAQRMTNLLLINLQRHSDHHVKPDRRFPLLRSWPEDAAPQLPHGYPLMVMLALAPPLWFRVMNRRVKAWRRRHYPEITDWSAYKSGAHPS